MKIFVDKKLNKSDYHIYSSRWKFWIYSKMIKEKIISNSIMIFFDSKSNKKPINLFLKQ